MSIDDRWEFRLFDTTSGLLLEPLPPVQFSWSNSLGDSRINGAIDKKSIQRQSLVWKYHALPDWDARTMNRMLMPDLHGVLISFDGRPLLWGIIGDRDDSWVDTSFPVNGIMTLLASRIIVSNWYQWNAMIADWSAKGLSLGTIAKRIVQTAISNPGGNLNMTFDDDEVTGGVNGNDANYHERNYPPYDVANNDAASLITNISNTENGPDIDFRPYLTEDGQHVALHMLFGKEAYPFIEQRNDIVLPLSAKAGPLVEFKQTVSASYRADRVYGTGDGEDKGTRTSMATDLSFVQQGWPLKEATASFTSVSRQDTLDANTKAELRPYPLAQWEVTVRADDPQYPLGTYWPGDEVTMPIRGHRIIPDGVYRSRVMEMSGSESMNVKLKLDAMRAVV